jgi:hypothetical protein
MRETLDMKIYGIIEDGGDGSSCLLWYNEEDAEHVPSDEYENFDYVQGCGGSPSQVINIPDGYTPEDIGIMMSEINR